MDELVHYFKKNIKLAWKSVRFQYKQYFCFFVAVFIVQMGYGLITLTADNNNAIEYQYVKEEYDYHLVLKDLNEDQFLFMTNDELTVFTNDYIFDILRAIPHGATYDVFVKLVGETAEQIETSFERFQLRYFPPLSELSEEGFGYDTTPLLRFDKNRADNKMAYVQLSLLLGVVSFFLLMVLYQIRMNHYKFTYGIYMSFGADFKKLFSTSFWEMIVVCFLTFLPASICATATTFFIYRLNGQPYQLFIFAYVKILFFSAILVVLSVIVPILRLSKETPLSLILAEDNSHLVVSPMRSFSMEKKKFPLHYEWISLWRFRKYALQLLVTAVIFSAIFVCGVFYSELYAIRLQYPQPQFTTQSSVPYTDAMKKELEEISGIKQITQSVSVDATSIQSHILLKKENAKSFSNFVIYPKETGLRAVNSCYYSPTDQSMIEYLENYTYEGDLNAVLTNEKTIIISDSISNTQKFKFKVGDTISIAKYIGKTRDADASVSGNMLLKSEIRFYKYEYTEYTIGAILKDIPCRETFPIFLSHADFTELTGQEGNAFSLSLFIEENLDIEEVKQIEEELRIWTSHFPNGKLTNTHALSLKTIEANKNQYPVDLIMSFLILLIAPLIWFFSQILFYSTRKKEFTILQSMAALDPAIKKIHHIDGIFFSIFAFFLCIGMSYGGIYLIYKFVNVILPKFDRSFLIRYPFHVPLIPLLLAVVLSVVCAYGSVMISHHFYHKKKAATDTSIEENEE